jgi:EmrB/QacA subfamily drug resistance transporter
VRERGAPSPEAVHQAGTEYTHRQILVIMSGLMLGMLLAALDQTIVATALTTISRDFHRLDLYSWVVTSYLLTSTVTTPLYGKISDQFGRKRIFQFAIVVFLLGSVLSGLSQNMYQLILFRGVQGLGAGGLMSLAMAIVGDVIPPRQRGRYQGYFGAVFGTSSVLGPLVGGFLVDQLSWRWVFYVNLPLGILALVVVNRVLHLDHNPRKSKIDVAGSVLIVSGVALFLMAVQQVGTSAHISAASAALAVSGLILVGAFIWWETKAAEPVIPLRLFRNRVFTVTNLLGFITGAVMFGAIIFPPQYLQLVRGVSPTVSGLRLLPLMGAMVACSIVSGRLISRTGRYKVFVVAGTLILAIGVALLATTTIHTSVLLFSLPLVVLGIGLGMFMQTLVIAIQNAVDISDLGVSTGAVTFFRTLGGAMGASILGAVLVGQERSHLAADVVRYGARVGQQHAFTNGMDKAYLWAVPVALISFGLSFLLRELKLREGTLPAPQLEGGALAPAGDAGRAVAAVAPMGESAAGTDAHSVPVSTS